MCYSDATYQLLLPLFLTLFHLSGICSLKDVKIQMPQAVINGRDVTLNCSFDLENEGLYSLKWYKILDNRTQEFFRYAPKEKDPFRVFPVRGIHVNRVKNTATKILLKRVTREINGQFCCEVTAEKPSFYTQMATGYLEVVDPPSTEPFINAVSNYSIDDYFQLNCTSKLSYPNANISWFINKHAVAEKSPYIITRQFPYEGFVTVVSTIRKKFVRKHFENNQMILRCSVSIYDVYFRNAEIKFDLVDFNKIILHSDLPHPHSSSSPRNEEDENSELSSLEHYYLTFFSNNSNICAINLTLLIIVLLINFLHVLIIIIS